MNFYQELGVKETAGPEEIKAAYRKLAALHHPDKNPDNPKEAEEKFKKISAAYDTLKDPVKKQNYDLSLSGKPGQTNFYTHRYSNIPEDVLKEIFPGSTFEHFFGFQQQPGKAKEVKNKDVYISMAVSIQEAFSGTEKLAQIKEGTQTKTLSIVIPKGVRNGMKLRLKAQAPRQNLNIPAGDLIVQLNIQNQNDLAIVGDNLVSILEISPIDALIGSTKEYKNIDGEKISVDVPFGTRHTEYITIFGKGMTISNSDNRGDLLLQVQTTPIKDLPERLKNRLKKISEEIKKNLK
jgi:curved DNA-binding protein